MAWRRRACSWSDCSLPGPVHAGDVSTARSRKNRVYAERSRTTGRLHLNWVGHKATVAGSGFSAGGELPQGRPDASIPSRAPGQPGEPRVDRTQLHNLTDILLLSVLAVICGAGGFVAIALFGKLHAA
ncbi:MAG: transposase family protein [Caldilineaceae bacterium SB0665_bin_21]|nr:transposase family protein [Caldilineaceae bacterium SB0665_bin_21]MYA04080.1 transposase family protein [Caldilineaceae bacterium SB0664_bin_22]MYC63052.1 transposase family protein [Caldilineaceae bacterium SB0661_bin_34]